MISVFHFGTNLTPRNERKCHLKKMFYQSAFFARLTSHLLHLMSNNELQFNLLIFEKIILRKYQLRKKNKRILCQEQFSSNLECLFFFFLVNLIELDRIRKFLPGFYYKSV